MFTASYSRPVGLRASRNSCLCLSSHCRSAEITGIHGLHLVLYGFWRFELRPRTLVARAWPTMASPSPPRLLSDWLVLQPPFSRALLGSHSGSTWLYPDRQFWVPRSLDDSAASDSSLSAPSSSILEHFILSRSSPDSPPHLFSPLSLIPPRELWNPHLQTLV